MSRTITMRLTAAACAAAGLGVAVGTSAAPAAPPAVRHHAAGGLTAREAANTRAAVDLLRGSFELRQPRRYAELYIDATTYIQHNPQFANGREAFITGVEGFLSQTPKIERPLVRTIAQGDLVVVQGSVKTGPEDRGTVIADTFRFNRQGKIVEHWDVLQPVAETSANGNPQV